MSWDNRTLRLDEPCKECPFRKKAPPGYLGGYRLETYAEPPAVGMPTTCHRSDKGADDPRTSYCAGALAVIANDPDVEPLEEYEEAAAAIGKRDDCFETVDAFREHHKDAHKFVVHRN